MTHVQVLESRRFLSIVWANRGRDGFAEQYGENAAVARELVDAAMADWNAAVNVPGKFKVTVKAKDIEPNLRDSSTLGFTVGKAITMDVDAAGGRWYFDEDLADNSDFGDVINAYAAESVTKAKATDFFSVVLHELGHVLSFKSTDEPYVTELPRRNIKDVFHTSREDDLMNAIVSDDTRHLISPFDIVHTKFGKKLVDPTAPRVFT